MPCNPRDINPKSQDKYLTYYYSHPRAFQIYCSGTDRRYLFPYFETKVTEPKKYLNSEDFEKGLKALDTELRNDPITVAFAPITVITVGGFLAVTYLKNRTATGDLDYLLPPQWPDDKDIKTPLRQAIRKVTMGLDFNEEWANDDVSLFVTSQARETLFQQAKEQNIVLFTGKHIRVLAAPIEWAIERKVRRLYTGERDRKAGFDMSDCLTMLKYLRDRNDGPLDEEHIRTQNVNGFDVVPDKKNNGQHCRSVL